MKPFVLILLMAIDASAQVVADFVYFHHPSELFQGTHQDWLEGVGSRSGFSSGTRLQQVYSAEPFRVIAPQGGWIDTIGFFADKSWSGNISRQMKGLQIRMGTTSQSPGDLKAGFSENLPGSMSEVRSVDYSSSLALASDGRQPRGPLFFIGFERPYFYDPNLGNLIFDIHPTVGFGIQLDHHPNGNGEFGSVFIDAGFGTEPSFGEVSAGGFPTILRLNRIPEPGSVGLAALGGAAMLAASGLRKQNQG